jgi:ribose 5-phosphate isomerase B
MCRSPIAEGLARKMLGSIVEAESAGTGAMDGRGAAKNAIEIMRSQFGIDLSKHRSRNVSDVALDDFDYIVPMDDDVADDLRRTYPRISSRIMESWKIDDPFGRGLEAYERSADEIQKWVEELCLYLRDKSA